jgi:hypothetical protein
MFLDISSFSELDSDLTEQKKEWKSTCKKLLELDSELIYNEPEPVDEEDSAGEQETGAEETGLEPILDSPSGLSLRIINLSLLCFIFLDLSLQTHILVPYEAYIAQKAVSDYFQLSPPKLILLPVSVILPLLYQINKA